MKSSWCQYICENLCLLGWFHVDVLVTLFDHVVPVYTFKMFCFHSYDARASQICVNLNGDTFLVSREKKNLVFLETTMYESSIFWMSMTVCINWVVNCVLFLTWGYVRETLLDLKQNLKRLHNTRFSISILCTKK